jgi:hypothetical protein
MNETRLSAMIRKLFSAWVILGGIGMAILLLMVFLVSVFALRANIERYPSGTAILNIIPAPTDTVLVPLPTASPTPTPGELATPPGGIGVNVGALVQGRMVYEFALSQACRGRLNLWALRQRFSRLKMDPRKRMGIPGGFW